MTTTRKRALGAIIGAAVALFAQLLPAAFQLPVYTLIGAIAAYWQIDITPEVPAEPPGTPDDPMTR
jgi:hypothetical protein